MAANTIPMTRHAARRTAQRNISSKAIDAALYYGKVIHRTGAVFHILRSKDIHKHPELHPYVGTTILISKEGAMMTAYCNPGSYSIIKKKPKRRSV